MDRYIPVKRLQKRIDTIKARRENRAKIFIWADHIIIAVIGMTGTITLVMLILKLLWLMM